MAESRSDRLPSVPEQGEKPEQSHILDSFDAENGRPQTAEYDPHADSEIEKQVVRKLDWNLVPLVMAICEYQLPGYVTMRVLTHYRSRSSLFPRSRQYRVRCY
jgi:hypothetical protein